MVGSFIGAFRIPFPAKIGFCGSSFRHIRLWRSGFAELVPEDLGTEMVRAV